MDDSLSNQPDQTTDEKNLSMEEIEAEDATSLPNKEVLSLLDVNANVDLGLDLAAPVDLAAAANLNVAAPIEASAAANVLSPGAEAVSLADQHGAIDQTISGQASATAPQHAEVTQSGGTSGAGTGTAADGAPAPAGDVAAPGTAHPATSGPVPTDGTSGTAPAQGGSTAPAESGAGTGTPADAGATAPADATGATTGDASSLLNGGSLLDANVNIDANANLAAPVDGAVAANANAAAPIDAAVSANVDSPDSAAVAEAPQQVDIQQNLDQVSADATANQDANVSQ